MENKNLKYNAHELADKWLKGTITPEEKAWYEEWYGSFDDSELKLPENQAQNSDAIRRRIYRKLQADIRSERKTAKSTGRIRQWLAAACLLFFTLGVYFFNTIATKPEAVTASSPAEAPIAPGSSKAVLTLADGSKITLDDAHIGKLGEQSGIRIAKTSDGQLAYTIHDAPSSADASGKMYNQIETPKGGQYQVNLPDGTRVWLNAASSIRFPVAFTGKERKVELTGEAYFEVAKAGIPFLVNAAGQQIEVLGTHFNVMAYNDESHIVTTLVEGAVKVTSRHNVSLLKPGEKALFDRNQQNIRVTAANTEEAVAWKNGYFMFINESIPGMMKKISRWYNVEVIYKGAVSDKKIGGVFSRSKSITELLSYIEQLTGTVHFKIEGRRIIIMD